MSYNDQNIWTREWNKTLFNTTSAASYFSPIIDTLFPNNSLGCIKAEVIEIVREREDVVSVILKPNRKFKSFVPGQYVEITIPINAVNYNRIFSISSSLQHFKKTHQITLTIQKQNEGKITSWLHENLKKGDIIEISEPMGEFVLPKEDKSILFIAAGSGITPIRSMMYQALERKLPVTLIYYCHAMGDHLFEKELLDLNNHLVNIVLIDTETQGRISSRQIEKVCSSIKDRQIYICGPSAMLFTTQKVMKEFHINDSQITVERFRPFNFSSHDLAHIEGTVSVPKLSKRDIVVEATSNILTTLEQNGVYPKHGCRMGICKKCQCTKKSGVVYNQLTQQFSEANEEKIIICSTVPVGAVELEF